MRSVPAHIQAALAADLKVGEYKVAGRITVEPHWWLNATGGLPPRMAPTPTAPFTETIVRRLFNYYGYQTNDEIANAVQNPPPTETAEERITRIAGELNDQTRSWEEVETSIRGLPEIVETGRWQHSKTPIRWWQRADNNQEEVEIPNLRTIDIDRSIDSPAATLNFTIFNQKMRTNAGEGGAATVLGQPGYFWPLRGQSAEAAGRWDQEQNEWHNLLTQNALLRVYQGYGGENKTLDEALTDGNLMIEGAFLIDSVRGATDGTISVKCRDMMRLVIEQQLFVPLVPLELYPLSYFRWEYKNEAVNAQVRDITTVTPGATVPTVASGNRPCAYYDSSTDWWSPTYGGAGPGSNWGLHGHYPAGAIDNDASTYWLSNGNANGTAPYAYDWIEFDTLGEAVNAVYLLPWGGNYECFVSVLENNVWQGDPNVPIPYDPTGLGATQSYVDTGAAIPYVATFTVPWEQEGEYWLPRMYAAQRIRITFHLGTDSGIGPFVYREGLREFAPRIAADAPGPTSSGQAISSTQHLEPVFFAATSILDPADLSATGYLTVSSLNQVDAFGDARVYNQSGGDIPSNATVAGVAFTKTHKGYYVLQIDGRVTCYGDAAFYGSPSINENPTIDPLPNGWGNIFADILVTPTGLGYWVTRWDGTIRSYGDAPSFAPVTDFGSEVLSRACTHPTDFGLFMISSGGLVRVRGAATHYGDWVGPPLSLNSVEFVSDIQCTHDGSGYWLLSSAGQVHAHGAAPDHGQITDPIITTDNFQRYYELLPAPDDLGYVLMRGDGTMFPLGTVDFFGGPIPGTQAELRYPGNYEFYEDIIKDLLLWSGFWLKEDLGPLDTPEVFGTIEATGVYAHDALDPTLFDKKPVIDAINTLKEVVGFIIYCSEDGGFNFVAPNVFQPGNFLDDGTHTAAVTEIDEKIDLVDYGVELPAGPLRSEIIISSEKVDPHNPSTQTVNYTPPTAQLLRGMIRPAMWVNGHFDNRGEAKIMAELIAMQIYFQLRLGQARVWCNPAVQLNDQVRFMERQMSETYYHWVRGIHTIMDLDQGTWFMELTSSWLGSESTWAITRDGVTQGASWLAPFVLSEATINWLRSNPRKVRIPELRGPLLQGATYISGGNLGSSPSGSGAAAG